MKRIIAAIMVLSLMIAFSACGNNAETSATGNVSTGTVTEATDTQGGSPAQNENEDDLIEDAAWDALEALGNVETENGILFVTITIPADFIGEGITQESIDAQAGENFISGKVNEDGSVTYKLTKKQHKAMLDSIVSEMDDGINELIDSGEYAFTKIEHNDDYTEFSVHLSTNDVGFAESLMSMAFYMYGGMYAIFSGRAADNVAVNFYAPDGTLISTANSSEMGN